MNSIRMKAWGILFFGAISGCAPQAAETNEPQASQSFPFYTEDVAGNSSFRPIRPSISALASRTSVRLQDDRVLVAGGYNSRNYEPSANAELFDPVTETWKKLPPMHYERSDGLTFVLKDGRVLIMDVRESINDPSPYKSGIPEIFDPKTERWTDCERLDSMIWIDSATTTTATLLADGRVLVTGDIEKTAVGYFFDTNTLTWSLAPPMKYSRAGHTATLLADGRVLVAGGYDPASGGYRLIAEIFDPITNQWSEAATMNAGHQYHVAQLLPDKRVILLDGLTSVGQTVDVELFDLDVGALGQWIVGPPFSSNHENRRNFAVVTLPDEGILVVGGYVEESIETESLYFPISNQTWFSVGKLKTSRDRLTATTLKDGRILIAGGASTDADFQAAPLRLAELYVPNSSPWRPLPTVGGTSFSHTATRLVDGRVLLTGWSQNLHDAFIFSPNTNTFTKTAPMLTPRESGAATLLEDGRVMVLGGIDNDTFEALRSVEIFDLATESWSEGPSMNAVFSNPVAARLSNGRVLVAGEVPNDSVGLTPELFDPQLGTWTPLEAFPLRGNWMTGIAALPDGRAVLAGFQVSTGESVIQTIDMLNKSYDQVFLPDLYVTQGNAMLTLPNGQVLIASKGKSSSNVGLFDSIEQQWHFLGNTNITPPMAILPSGDVLWANAKDLLYQRAGILDVQREQITLVASPYGPFDFNQGYRLTPLLDGRILLTGPEDSGSNLGALAYGKSKGEPCAGKFECSSGYCVDGYCCNEACDNVDSCNACAFSRGADENGTCTAVEACAPANGKCTMVKTCAPFQCDRIEIRSDGQDAFCTDHCSRAADCAHGYVCDLAGKCVSLKNVDIDAGCTVALHESPSRAAFGMAGLLLALSRLRRSAARRRSRQNVS